MPSTRLLPALLLVVCVWCHAALSFEDTLALARTGDAAAQYQVGGMYRDGDGTTADAQAALDWYRKAAAQGVGKAANDAGALLEDGIAGQPDLVAARGWYAQAAQQPYGLAERNLGRMLEYGRGGPKDPVAALSWYKKAVTHGDGEAARRAGNMLLEAHGVPEDRMESARMFKLGAQLHAPGAIERLGHMYLNGYGVDHDPVQAVALFREAIAIGNARASTQLAWCMELGIGLARDEAGAVALYDAAAQQGDPFSRKQLVMMLEDGRGTPADPTRAAALVAAMVRDDDLDGLVNLARAYRQRQWIAKAQPLWKAALQIAERKAAATHDPAWTRRVVVWYAQFEAETGHVLQAESMLRKSIATIEAQQGQSDPVLVDTLTTLGAVLASEDRYVEATAVLERALTIGRASQTDFFGAATLLGNIALRFDRLQDAGTDYSDARTHLFVAYPIGDVAFADNDASVAGLKIKYGAFDAAGKLLRSALQTQAALRRPEQPPVYATTALLAELALREQRLDDAVELSQNALNIAEERFGKEHCMTALAMSALGTALVQRGDLAQAQAMLVPALPIAERMCGLGHVDIASVLHALANLARAQGQLVPAEQHIRRALAFNEAAFGPAHSQVAMNLDMLGQIRLAQGNVAGAEQALARAWTIRRGTGINPQETRRSAVRLAAVYRTLQNEPDALLVDAWLQALP
jgi:TPR repeat protein